MLFMFSIISFTSIGRTKDNIIICPQTAVLIGVNVFNAEKKDSSEKYILAPDKQIQHPDSNMYTQYWFPDKPSEHLKKFAECLYPNANNASHFSWEHFILEIPSTMTCELTFISKPSDKGLITPQSQATFVCQ